MIEKIFILDDDETACGLAEMALKKEGFEVKTHTKAIGATNQIRTFGPHLVLLDVMMPALSGDNMVDIIYKGVTPRPKILFYSNKSPQDLRDLVDKTGVDGFVCKVDGPSVLVDAVRSALAAK